jgi:hypothetical protein
LFRPGGSALASSEFVAIWLGSPRQRELALSEDRDLRCSYDQPLKDSFHRQNDPMQLIAHNAKRDRKNTLPRVASSEYLIAGSALLLLLAAQ